MGRRSRAKDREIRRAIPYFCQRDRRRVKPLAEKGSLSYMFYLNKPTNQKAGDQLLARGIISDPELIAKWNAVGIVAGGSCSNFPGTSPAGPTDADVAECDFNKYRGRGFVQLTFRDNYETFLDPSLLAAGLKKAD